MGKNKMAPFRPISLLTKVCHLILWFLLLRKVDAEGKAQPRAAYQQPVATFEAKLEEISRVANVMVSKIPLEILVGPRYTKKRNIPGEAQEESQFSHPHFDSQPDPDFDLNLNLNLDLNLTQPFKFQNKFPTNVSESLDSDQFDTEQLPLDDSPMESSRFFGHRKWTVPDLLQFNGYEYNEHEVTTEDGYILTLFQLLPCKGTDPNPANPASVSIYVHGLMFSAVEWLIGDPGAIYPYDGVNSGREVWLINLRGNEYGRRHKIFSPHNPAFWRFSFHEQGRYDIPAILEYVLKHSVVPIRETNQQINFLCEGLGCTVLYVFMDLHGKKYQDKIKTMIAISPLAYTSRTTAPVINLIPYADHFRAFPTDGPVFKSTIANFLHFSVPELCLLKIQERSLCEAAIFYMNGDGTSNLGPGVIRRYFEHFPSTTSKRNLVHYLQLLKTDVFRQFDYGTKLNLLHYNQSVPPPYNLYNVQIPTISLYGQTDLVLDPLDAEQTLASFGPSQRGRGHYQITDYTNIEFLYDDLLPQAINAIIDSGIS